MHDVQRPSRGFTLIELLVVLTILGVMLGIGIPSFRDFVANQAVKSASFDLATAMVLARSEAIKRNGDVVLAPVNGGDWNTGWTVKSGATTLLSRESPSDVSIVAKLTDNCPNPPTEVTFTSNGRPDASSKFQIAGASSAVRCVRADLTGIPSTTTVACTCP